jgi:hypothetical protein
MAPDHQGIRALDTTDARYLTVTWSTAHTAGVGQLILGARIVVDHPGGSDIEEGHVHQSCSCGGGPDQRPRADIGSREAGLETGGRGLIRGRIPAVLLAHSDLGV